MLVKIFEKSVSLDIPPQKNNSFHVWSMEYLPRKGLMDFKNHSAEKILNL